MFNTKAVVTSSDVANPKVIKRVRYAIMFCKTDLVQLLLSRGANSNSIVEGGRTALQLAEDAANGESEEFEDLPSPEAYKSVVAILKQFTKTD